MKLNLSVTKKSALLAFVLTVSTSAVFAQILPGPAGVGNSDGSNGQPKSVMWLDASSNVTKDSKNRVSAWNDISGNGNNATSNGNKPRPTSVGNTINGYPVVRFTFNGNQYLTFDGNCIANTEYSIFSVAQRRSDKNAFIVGGNSDQDNSALSLGIKDDETFMFSEYGTCGGSGNTNEFLATHDFGSNPPYLFSSVRKSMPDPWSKAVFLNGSMIGSQAFVCNNMLKNYNEATIGRHLINVTRNWLGFITNNYTYSDIDVAELILYASALNEAQRLIVDNYLGVKYARDLGANKLYNAPNEYRFDVIGVGTSDGIQKHTETSGNGGGLYLKENSSAPFDESNEFVMAGHNNVVASPVTTELPTLAKGNVLARSNRIWYVDRTGTSTSVKMGFKLDEVGLAAESASQIFVLLYRDGATGTFSAVPGMFSNAVAGKVWFTVDDANLKDGYYTIASTDLNNRVWYSLTSGSWDEPGIWTLDPSGVQPQNAEGFTPTTSPTAEFDEVVVLSGRNVNVLTEGKANSKLTVYGAVDFGIKTGHRFDNIEGTGRILLAGDNFPDGDATNFVSKGLGEGTVEYYGVSRELTIPRTFFNVIVDMTAGNELTLRADYNLNGDFTVKNGTFKINSDASTTALNMTVNGNMQIEKTGKVAVGTANARHQLNLYENFTNLGEAKFTNRTTADYSAEATDGIVDVNFLNASANQSVLCRGITNFYRIKVDKGTDKTYELSIDASATANFNLFGFANDVHNPATAQLTTNENALGLLHGSVRLGNSLAIPVLSLENYNISENAQITVDGAVLNQDEGSSLTVFGTLKSKTGTINVGNTKGGAIVLAENGTLNIDGGTLNVNQIRVADGAGNNGSYIQTAGATNVLGTMIGNNYFAFMLPNASSVFNMLGGTLTVNNAAGTGGILIGSSSENVQVTGGTVNANIASNNNFIINSTAPFWNLSLKNSSGNANVFRLVAANNVGASNANYAAQPLRVLNDLRLWGKQSGGASYATVELVPGTNDVYIGGSFYVESGAKYIAVSGGSAPYDTEAAQPTARNTTYFNKTSGTLGVEYLYNGDVSNSLEFGDLVVDRTSGYELQMATPTGRLDESVILDVNGSATVKSGILDQGRYSIRTWGPIVNYGRMGKYIAGTTPDRAQIRIADNANLTISSSKTAVFGNVKIDVSPSRLITIMGDAYMENLEFAKGLVYLKNYELKLDNLWGLNAGLFEAITTSSKLKVGDTGYSGESMIYTNGDAGDGGLKIKVVENSLAENEANRLNNRAPITFPLGFVHNNVLYFRPAQMVVKNFGDDGYVTMRPVSGYLQTTNNSGGKLLQHYWRVTNEGFDAKPTVAYRFYYRNSNAAANNNVVDLYDTTPEEETTFLGGKVLDETPYTRLYEDATDINRTDDTRMIVINGASTNGTFNNSVAGIELENANYTAGVQNRFTGSVRIFYTIDQTREAMWNNKNAWSRSDNLNPAYSPHDSRQNKADMLPGAGDVVEIGWVPWDDANRASLLGQPHSIWVTDTREVAEVVFLQMLDAAGNPTARVYRSNFQFRPTLNINGIDDYDGINGTDNGVLTVKLVKGEGLFWNRSSDPDYTKMDIGDFARQDSSYVIYENFTNNRMIYNSADLFPNLYISNNNWGANNHDFTFVRDLETTGNVELLGDVNLVLNTEATGDITVGRNLIMFTSNSSGGGAELRYGGAGPARKVVVKGDLQLENQGSKISVVGSNDQIFHELHVEGNIFQGTSNFSSDGLQLIPSWGKDRVILYLDGDKSMEFNRVNLGGTDSRLYRVVVNKGASAATTAAFNTNFTLEGPTSGAGVAKALDLRNGTFIYNPARADNTIALSTGNDYFSIPSTTGLTIKRGIMTVSGNSGIALDGKLTLDGGTLNMGTGENHIEYSASGNSAISIAEGATMTVGGQIRRSTTSDEGILKYSQTGGNVSVGLVGASVSNRGVFEILNSGSSFAMDNGTLTIARTQTNPSISAFYFDPETSSIGGNSKIAIGNNATDATSIIGIYANKPLPNLEIVKGIATLQVVPATVTKLLDIKSGATFDANGLDLTLKGNLTVSGTFEPNGNTTYFSGTSGQAITGNGSMINFYNFDKTGSNTLTLNNNTPLKVSNEMLVRGGTFAANANDITVLGTMLNDGIFTYTGNGNGVRLSGTLAQTLSGNGTFGVLSIDNPKGVVVPVGNHLTITNSLKMMGGVFNVGQNYLDLGVNATIVESKPFSKTNMITTNISFNDNGVRKAFKAGATRNFIYPVGSGSKYTPVTLDVTGNGNNTGKITVVPSNEVHASVIDKNNALQYYWTLKSEGITGFTGTATMHCIKEDVKVTSPNTPAEYITAKLLNDGSGKWQKFDNTTFAENNNELRFTFNGNNDATISCDYTAGIDAAIPNKVAAYETQKTDNWDVSATWNPNVAGGPLGAITKINSAHTVTMTDNFYSEYSTEILGTLKVNETFGHRLGIVAGNGTLYSETGVIPAAVYDKFFAPTGGTVEFSGADNYEFLGNVLAVNNLTISGSGTKTMPNNDLLLNGDLLINGTSGLGVVNSYNKKLSVSGNITRTQGSFDAGTGASATVAVIGGDNQSIVGAFAGGNAFNNLQVNKEAGKVSVANDVEIDKQLSLNKGIVEVENGSVFKMNYGSSILGGSTTSFVTGELTAELMNGNSFTYPVGDITTQLSYGEMALKSVSGPSGICNWKVRYYYEQPPCDLESYKAPIAAIAKTEYWRITAPAGGQAYISIAMNGTNDVANGLGADLSNLRVVGYNTIDNKWEVIGGGSTISGTAASGRVTTAVRVNLGVYSCITLGAVTPLTAGSAWFRTNAVMSSCTQGGTNLIVEFSGSAPWEFTYTTNGANPKTITTSATPYTLSVTPPVGTTIYQLTSMKSTDVAVTHTLMNGLITTGKDKVTVTVNSAVTPILSASNNAVCEGTQVTFTATSGYSNYIFRVNGVVVQNSSANTYVTTSLPAGVASVDVEARASTGCSGKSSAQSITVNPKPAAAGAISGDASTCLSTTKTYTIPAIANATSYQWSVTGATIVRGQGERSVDIGFNTAGTAVIKVVGHNDCGDGASATMSVAVNASATTGVAGTIAGSFDICKGGSYTYSIPEVENATSYKWIYSGSGATIHGTDHEVTIDFASTATAGSLTVMGTNGCNDGAQSTQPITLNTLPSVTLGSVSGCEGSNISLAGSAVGGTGSYVYSWSGTETASLSAINIANPVFNKEGGISSSAAYDLTLTATDAKGCAGEATATVTVNERPRVNAGLDVLDICTGTAQVFMTGASVTGSYTGAPTWTVNQASVGVMTNSDMSAANAYFTPNSIYGEADLTLTVTGSNGCADASDVRHIKWSGVPVKPSAIVGSISVCKGATGVAYSVTKDNFVDTYTWSYSGTGATINQTDNSITIDFADDATDGTLTVSGSSACGNSDPQSVDIALNSVPAVPVITDVKACAGDAPLLTVKNPQTGCTYSWSVTAGVGYSVVMSGSDVSLTTPNNDTLFPEGTSETFDYPAVKVVSTNAAGCSNSATNNNANKMITILRMPRTGPPYHLKNGIAQ